MGLDTSHNCWHGAYSAFHRWRCELARAAGLPPLDLMEGFDEVSNPMSPLFFAYQSALKDGFHTTPFWRSIPISWECLKPDALYILLHHSDCEGEIEWQVCAAIADSIEKLLPNLPQGDGAGHIGNWQCKTQQFIDGLRAAYKAKENVEFH